MIILISITEKLYDSVIQTITVDLQHKKGALCGLLQTVQSTEVRSVHCLGLYLYYININFSKS